MLAEGMTTKEEQQQRRGNQTDWKESLFRLLYCSKEGLVSLQKRGHLCTFQLLGVIHLQGRPIVSA